MKEQQRKNYSSSSKKNSKSIIPRDPYVPSYSSKNDCNLVMIGCGGIGKTALELIPLLRGWFPAKLVKKIVIIEPDESFRLEKSYSSWYDDIVHIRAAITPSNMADICENVLPGKRMIMDASVGIDAVELMRYAWKHGCLYVNTSLECWETKDPEEIKASKNKLYERSLHYQYNRAVKLFRNESTREKPNASGNGFSARPTMIFDHGANPGLISHLAKRALLDCYAYYNRSKNGFGGSDLTMKLHHKEKGSLRRARSYYQQIVKNLKVHTIHISENDTQELRDSFDERKDTFYNTWSIPGFIAEALDPVQIGYGFDNRSFLPKQLQLSVSKHKRQEPTRTAVSNILTFVPGVDGCCSDIFKTEFKNVVGIKRNVRIYGMHGYDATANTMIITPKNTVEKIKGFIIPHGESNTLGAYISPQRTLTPNIYYVYHPSEPGMRSIAKLKKTIHKIQSHHSDKKNMPSLTTNAVAGTAASNHHDDHHKLRLLKKSHVLTQHELDVKANGYDSIGAFVQTKLRKRSSNHADAWLNWWTGTVLRISDVRKYGIRHAGPTECQVTIGFLSAARYALMNPEKGLCNPEFLCSDTILRWCKPYLGLFVSRPIILDEFTNSNHHHDD